MERTARPNSQSITTQYFSRDYAPREDRTRDAELSTHVISALHYQLAYVPRGEMD